MTRLNQFALLFLVVALGAGCSLVVGFDRSQITDAGPDASLEDAGGGSLCGNGTEDSGEACDDNNTTSGDGCSASCEMEPGWMCDRFGPGGCAATCGDGMTVGPEVCDDGATTACGACNADCTASGSGSTCGDGVICADTEVCDDGDTMSGDGCDAECAEVEDGWSCSGEPSTCAETCGDGMLDDTEGCDDGNNDADDGCSPACQEEAGWMCTSTGCSTTCGDGIVVTAMAEEECDDGGTADGDGCDASCEREDGYMCVNATGEASVCSTVCGDNIVVAGVEACDDGNAVTEAVCPYGTATCDVCQDDCLMELPRTGNVCGDGVVDMNAANEECDDGDGDGGDGCDASCDLETGWICTGTMPSVCTAECGDGIVVAGEEECDDDGTAPGDGCSATCTQETGWNCNGAEPSVCDAICGDGLVLGDEVCDDRNGSVCGLCSSDCRTARDLTPSTATLTVADGMTTPDAGTFSIDDGNGTALVFEINTNAGGATCPDNGGDLCIPINTADSAEQVAIAARASINGAPMFGVAASGTGAEIILTNDAIDGMSSGALGNTAIVLAGGLGTAWTVPGALSNGQGRDCNAGVACNVNDDCASVDCTGNVCN